MQRLGLVLPLLLSACAPPPLSSTENPDTFHPGLQYNGAVAGAFTSTAQVVEISAPIVPDSRVWQNKGGAGYPSTVAEARSLVRDTTFTFEGLLVSCQAGYPTIKIAAQGETLTPDQLATNYDQVSRCAYADHGAKPYWMPKILDDVDVCVEKLGAGWHLLSEGDLTSFTEVDYTFIRDTMSIAHGSDWFPREFYFSLDTYLRGADGSLKLANLAPGTTHVSPLPIASTDLDQLYVGDGHPIGVRCARLTAQ